MDSSKLQEFTYRELKLIAQDMGLMIPRSKSEIIYEIIKAFKEYENYKKNKIDRYEKFEQLGDKGKEGTTYLVKTKDGKEYAMKTFRKSKLSASLRKEAELQKLAADQGVSPNVIDIDTVSKYIVMEKMDGHLLDKIRKQGCLTRSQQRQIINIYRHLDKAGVFHGDGNLLNYMYKDDNIYIIDFGIAKEITLGLIKRLGTDTPNMSIMTLGLALKLRDMQFPVSSYQYIVKYLSDDQRDQFGFNSILSKKKSNK